MSDGLSFTALYATYALPRILDIADSLSPRVLRGFWSGFVRLPYGDMHDGNFLAFETAPPGFAIGQPVYVTAAGQPTQLGPSRPTQHGPSRPTQHGPAQATMTMIGVAISSTHVQLAQLDGSNFNFAKTVVLWIDDVVYFLREESSDPTAACIPVDAWNARQPRITAIGHDAIDPPRVVTLRCAPVDHLYAIDEVTGLVILEVSQKLELAWHPDGYLPAWLAPGVAVDDA